MKKILAVLLIAFSLLSLPGCGSGAAPAETSAPAVTAGPAETVQPAETAPPAAAAPVQTAAPAAENKDPNAIDVDLTQLSSKMVYSEVFAMVYEPDQYTGKTVKMKGLFATQEYNGKQLFACIVQDATACCAQGLEFEIADKLVYPDEYPEPGTEITVIGVFDAYEEEIDGSIYIYPVLRNARFA